MKKPSSDFRDFTRGGQIFTHSVLMFWQVTRGGLIIAFILFCCCLYGLMSYKASDYDGYIFWQSLEAKAKLVVHDNRVRHQIRNKDSSTVELKAIDFINSPKTKKHVLKYKQAFWGSCFYAALITLSFLTAYFTFLKIKGRRENLDIALFGQEQVAPETLKDLLKKAKKASHFQLAGVPLLKDAETQHFLLAGTTGTGKSLAMQELMDQVRQKGQRAIVYDIDRSFIPLYYRPEKDILLDPLDQRTPAWNIWQECRDLADFETAALSLMPEHLMGNDPFWLQSAQALFTYAALKLSQDPKVTTQALLEAIFAEDLAPLAKLVTGTPAAPLMLEHIEKMALSIKSTLATYSKSLLYLKEEKEEPLFSIRRWIEGKGDSWLFIASNAQKITALKPLISLWLDIASKATLSLSASQHRRLWFFLDELPSLHKLPSLMNALSRGRKYGACFVAAIQDIHQLHAIYGRNYAESLSSLFNTKLFYRCQEPDSAAWMSKVLGTQALIEKKEGFSYGAHSMRDGVSIHQERRQEAIVEPSLFLELPDLAAFLKLPGAWPVTRLEFDLKQRDANVAPFIPRDLSDILKRLERASKTIEKHLPPTVSEVAEPTPPLKSSTLKEIAPLREI